MPTPGVRIKAGSDVVMARAAPENAKEKSNIRMARETLD
jgi:hypothetical protein